MLFLAASRTVTRTKSEQIGHRCKANSIANSGLHVVSPLCGYALLGRAQISGQCISHRRNSSELSQRRRETLLYSWTAPR